METERLHYVDGLVDLESSTACSGRLGGGGGGGNQLLFACFATDRQSRATFDRVDVPRPDLIACRILYQPDLVKRYVQYVM